MSSLQSPEGHQRFQVYFNFKGRFEAQPADADVIDPLWLYNVDKEDLPKLMAETPLTKDDLVRILKARKMTCEDLAQIVREWKD